MQSVRFAFCLGALLLTVSLFAKETCSSEDSSPQRALQQQKIEDEVARQLAEREENLWQFGVLPNGGGVFAHSPDDYYQFRILGHAQTAGTLVDDFSRASDQSVTGDGVKASMLTQIQMRF